MLKKMSQVPTITKRTIWYKNEESYVNWTQNKWKIADQTSQEQVKSHRMNLSNLIRIITKEEDFVAGRVSDGTQLAVTRINVIAENINVATRNDVLGCHVLPEPVEDVDLLGVGWVDIEHAQFVGVRKDGSNRADAVICLVADVQHSIGCYCDCRYRIEPIISIKFGI